MFPDKNNKDVAMVSAYPGYFIGSSSDTKQKEACIRFLKYMLSEKVQKRILEETEQIPANEHVVLDAYKEAMPRLYQAASLVLGADRKIEVPDNLWPADQKTYFTGNIFRVLTGAMTPEDFQKRLGKMRTTENNSQK